MCRLLAMIACSTAMLVVRGGAPVMSLRLLDVTERADELDARRLVADAGVRRGVVRQLARPSPEWMSPVTNSVSRDLVVADVLEDLAPVGGVAVPLVDVVRQRRPRAAARSRR